MAASQIAEGTRVLLVEDDYFIASDLARRLDQLGFDVVGPLPGVEEALERIRAGDNIAAAMLDIRLSGEMVFPVADELERRAVPFIFATAFDPQVVPARHADKLLLRKPLEDRAIVAALANVLEPAAVANDDLQRNAILRRLPQQQLGQISRFLRRVHLPRGAVMEVQNQKVTRVYFPIDCVASLIAVGRQGTRIETGLIGREGMTGMGIAIGDDRTSHELINQVEGDALVMAALDFRAALHLAPDLGLLGARFSRILGVQVSHTALVNAKFELRQRLARWLLMVQDRVPLQSFDLTHEYLSIMLGVRRSSVTDAIHVLEGEKLIRATRSNIEIRDRVQLIKIAGEAYGTPEAEYERLMHLPLTRELPSELIRPVA
ncbi:helix-turn-helix domain-containing protein [Rhizobium sp.]|uniref:helix-turn-helix domain-containing protein n=1 Tax=Rhizobium sp. TaxID=391 RepID=UPI003F813377